MCLFFLMLNTYCLYAQNDRNVQLNTFHICAAFFLNWWSTPVVKYHQLAEEAYLLANYKSISLLNHSVFIFHSKLHLQM